MTAEAVGADIFITDRPYLHNMGWDAAPGVTYCNIEEALALLGLYLRAQDSFVFFRSPSGGATFRMNRGLYTWVGARELVPSAWRWFSACVQTSQATGNDSLLFLGQSALQRIQRCLQVRDQIHIELNKPQDNDTGDEALTQLDMALLLLMGAIDAAARVAHVTLDLSGKPSTAGWQRNSWMKKVRTASPGLAALFDTQSEYTLVLSILTVLRNSIHGEALTAIAVGTGLQRDRTLMSLPSSQVELVLHALDSLGGREIWGVEDLVSGQIHADPGIFFEVLLPRILSMLNRIMDETPVELLPGVNLHSSHLEAPVVKDSEPFHLETREAIRWSLGL